ncbi:MAG: flagellar hook-associated protein FlgL, partial [Desulfatiglandales bacterium]
MRITNKYMGDNLVEAIRRSTEKLAKIQHEVSTGKKVNRLSDDPISSARILDYDALIKAADQFKRNTEFGLAWAQQTESALDSASSILIRIKQLAVYQSTDTANAQTRKATANEVWNLYDELLRLGNTKFQGRYIFSGFLTDKQPFGRQPDNSIIYNGDSNEIEIHISENEKVPINLIGSEVFQGVGIFGIDIFSVVKNVAEAMESDDRDKIAAEIENLGYSIDQINQERAKIGSRINRFQDNIQFIDDYKTNLTDLLSQLEDTDMADAMTRLA